ALVCGGAELTLGQTIDTVVLDNVDERHIAAHGVLELAQTDRSGITVAADTDGVQTAVDDNCAGRHRRHTPVDRVEAVTIAQEIGRSLAAAADATELDDLRLVQVEFPNRVDDALANAVVTAALAQGRR